MATTAFFLIFSDVVGTQYERDGRASRGFINVYLCNITSKDIHINTYRYVYYYFDWLSREQKGPIYGAQSSNKLFDGFISFYCVESMAYQFHALCMGLGR